VALVKTDAVYVKTLEWIVGGSCGQFWGWSDDRRVIFLSGRSVQLSAHEGLAEEPYHSLGKLVTEKPVDFVGFDNVVKFNKNRQNDDNVVNAYKS